MEVSPNWLFFALNVNLQKRIETISLHRLLEKKLNNKIFSSLNEYHLTLIHSLNYNDYNHNNCNNFIEFNKHNDKEDMFTYGNLDIFKVSNSIQKRLLKSSLLNKNITFNLSLKNTYIDVTGDYLSLCFDSADCVSNIFNTNINVKEYKEMVEDEIQVYCQYTKFIPHISILKIRNNKANEITKHMNTIKETIFEYFQNEIQLNKPYTNYNIKGNKE